MMLGNDYILDQYQPEEINNVPGTCYVATDLSKLLFFHSKLKRSGIICINVGYTIIFIFSFASRLF